MFTGQLQLQPLEKNGNYIEMAEVLFVGTNGFTGTGLLMNSTELGWAVSGAGTFFPADMIKGFCYLAAVDFGDAEINQDNNRAYQRAVGKAQQR